MRSIFRWPEYDAAFVGRRYDLIARFFVLFEWLFLLPRDMRARAVHRLDVPSGGRVLEVGCGTGRNLAHLVHAVGDRGHVYGIDISDGMLQRARVLIASRQWTNVTLLRADASAFELPELVDGALFSLSYAVIPDRRAALRRAWDLVRPGCRLVIMDAKVPQGLLGRVLRPLVLLESKATVLGNPDVQPCNELRELTDQISYEERQFGTYYICRATKD